MDKNINILTLFLCFCLVLIAITGSYRYNSKSVANSLEIYQRHHSIYHDAYKGLVNVSAMNNKTTTANGVVNVSVINNNITTTQVTNSSMEKVEQIETDGIYYAKFETYFKYIKFLDDSSVITVSTNMSPEKAVKLINESLEGVPIGKYTIAGKNIKFTTIQEKAEGKVVKVEYKGKKKQGKLYLSSYSQATKNQRQLIYKYYKEIID